MLRTVLVLVDVSPVITINPIFYGLVADMAKGSVLEKTFFDI